jgi:hypothetical protein
MSRRRRTWVRLAPLVLASGTVWSLVVALATACGASRSGSSAEAPATELEAAPGLETGLDDGASGTDEASGPSGFISVAATDLGGGSLGAVFDGTPVLRPGCRATQVYGSCVVYGCPADPDAGPSAGAGTLTFTGGALEAGVVLDAGATGVYESDTPGAPFSPGQTLAVTASGAGVPAFGPQAVSTPHPLNLTTLATDGGTLAVPTAQDFGFAWAGGGQESVAILTASGVAADGSFVLLQCTYDAIGGEGVLPSPLLAAVRGVSQGTLGWGQANATMFDAGPWSITLLAGAYGSTPATFE